MSPEVSLSLLHELTQPPPLLDDLPTGRLTLAHRQRAISHEGGLERLRCFLAKLRAKENVTIAVLGGSVSAGSSSRVRQDQSGLFHRKVQRWLQSRFATAGVSHVNAAMPAVPPGYMEQCLALHIPQAVDLVFLESAANMCGGRKDRTAGRSKVVPPDECEVGRQSVERMLRQLLRYPKAPAVVMVHAFPYWTMETPKSWYHLYPRRGVGHSRRRPMAEHAPLSSPADLAFDFHQQWGHEANEVRDHRCRATPYPPARSAARARVPPGGGLHPHASVPAYSIVVQCPWTRVSLPSM